jgi:hypothetical protein
MTKRADVLTFKKVLGMVRNIPTQGGEMPVAPEPNGLCFCDCGMHPSPGSFFVQGHDKRAERYLTAISGATSIADRLAQLDFVPGSGKSLRQAAMEADPRLEPCGRRSKPLGGLPCRIIGQMPQIAAHRAAEDQHIPDE